MAQQNIDFGTFPDDPSADAIRTAFTKVQENFDEVYASTANAAVLSINRTAGRGITVNSPTGNVIVEANVASLSISSVTLRVGTSPNPVTNSAIYTNYSQTLYVEIPSTLSISNLITSGNISAGGNLTSLNANLGNAVIANYFIGAGNNLSNIQAANITGSVSTATTAGTVSQNAQSNITSLGTLTSLSVSGNIIAGNIYANVGIIGAQYLKGDGSNLTNLSIAGANVSGTVTNAITAGTITTNAQPNITSTGTLTTLSVSGNSNIGNVGTGIITATETITGGNLLTAGTLSVGGNTTLGNLSVSGNLTAGNIIVDGIVNGSSNVDITNTNGNVTVGVNGVNNVLIVTSTGANISGTFDVSGNITAGNISATTFTGNLTGNATRATTAGTVTTNAQPNITSTGTLASLSVSGNSNLGAVGNVRITGPAGYLINDGSGNLSFITVITQLIPGTANSLLFSSGANGINASSNIKFNDPQLDITGNLSVTGNANVGNIGANNIVGTLTTGNQPNITSVGILTGLTLNNTLNSNSSIVLNNVNANISTLGNISANYFIGNIQGANVTGTVANATYANTAGIANSVALANVSGAGNIASINISGNGSQILYGNGVFAAAPVTYGNSNVATFLGSYGSNTITTTGNVTVGNIIGNGQALTGITGANVTGQVSNSLVAGTVYTNAQPNITSLGILTSVSVSGNATVGNLITSGQISATGNVSGANFVGAGAGTPTITSTTNLDLSPTIAVRVVGSGVLTATGNITGANIIATNYHIRSVGTSISAAGSTQGTATGLTKEFNQVSTVSSGQGVVLPTGVAGMAITITNSSANSLLVYPASGGVINSLSTNASYSHPAAGTLQYITLTGTQWYTVGATYA